MSSVVVCCDTLVIEVHDKPDESLCDKNQTIDTGTLILIINKIRELNVL